MLLNYSDPGDLITQTERKDPTSFIISPGFVTRSAGPGFSPWHLGRPGIRSNFSVCYRELPGPGPLLGCRKRLLDLSSFCKGEQGTPLSPRNFKFLLDPREGKGKIQCQGRPGTVAGGHWPRRFHRTTKRTTMKGIPNVNSFYNIFWRTYLVQAPL